MDYDTIVSIDEALTVLADILTEKAMSRPQQKAMFAKAWSRTPGPQQQAEKARGTPGGAKYYRKFRKEYTSKYGLRADPAHAGHGMQKRKSVKRTKEPARRLKDKRRR